MGGGNGGKKEIGGRGEIEGKLRNVEIMNVRWE